MTLGIEVGGRVHKQFYRLIDAFAKFKADAGPQDDKLTTLTPPRPSKLLKAIFTQTKFSVTGRIQVARVKCVAERIMLITPHASAHKALPHYGGELMSV